MRIGILQTDSVQAQLRSRHGDYPDMFRALLSHPDARVPGQPVAQFRAIDATSARLPEAADCDAYVITGSRYSVYDDLPWIAPLAEFVDTVLAQRRRVIGICFGHQLLAHHFGGAAGLAEVGWRLGLHSAEVVSHEPWMNPTASSLSLLHSHRDQVFRLPDGARVILHDAQCPISGFVMGNALALQGHPEFTPAYTAALMATRRQQLAEAVYEAALTSLTKPANDRLAARWMLNFIYGEGS
jgi:GMP synthase-like glutamine amidotransferase